MEADYGDYVDIRITKVRFDGDPSHWELDIKYPDGESMGGGTGPSFAGIYDMAYSIIHGGDKHSNWEVNSWTDFDANERNK